MDWGADPRWAELRSSPRTWLVTGAAGFIGSHLVEALLSLGQIVIGLDNFATGHRANLEQAGANKATSFRLIEGDIRDPATCASAVAGVDVVLHQAALGSVPRSLADPLTSHAVNVTGFLQMLEAARQAHVPRFIYAASSSTYGDDPNLPKREERIGRPMSPYAATKAENELWADIYARSYGYRATGLRYFNVFGPRQDPDGPYAAVIPKWLRAMTVGEEVLINGDGETSRDFCFVANVVQANLLATLAPDTVQGEVFNVAVAERTSLNSLFKYLSEHLSAHGCMVRSSARHGAFRPGDVPHSEADIAKAQRLLGYRPTHDAAAGLDATVAWFLSENRDAA